MRAKVGIEYWGGGLEDLTEEIRVLIGKYNALQEAMDLTGGRGEKYEAMLNEAGDIDIQISILVDKEKKGIGAAERIGRLAKEITGKAVIVLLIGMTLAFGGVARAELNEYEVKKIAYFRDLITTIRNYTTPVIHLEQYKGYIFKDAKGVYLMLYGKNVTVEEFETWLNNYDENSQGDKKELCDITREFTYWPLYDEIIKEEKEKVKVGLEKLLEEAKVSK